jgi:hypothetical protein
MSALASSRLIHYFQTPRNKAMVEAVADEAQEVEVAVEQLYFDLTLANSTGVNLDVIGRRVGEKRAGRADADYRAAVRTAILVNTSDGTIEDLIQIVKSLIPTATVGANETYPAAFFLSPSTLGDVTFSTLYNMLVRAKPAGVRLELTYGLGTIGTEDGTTYVGGTIGSEDDTPLGFEISGTF